MMYSVSQVALAMGISPQRVRELLAEGRIKGQKLGRDWVITELGYTLNRNYPGKGDKGQALEGGQNNENS